MVRVCVDAGGTFTDFVVISDSGEVQSFKVPSTPEDPAQAVLHGLQRVSESSELRHGTTVATNAILQGKFARTAFITNEGFKHLLHIARQTRPDLYDLEPRVPHPPVARSDCFGAQCRLLPNGEELVPLALDSLPDLSGYEAVAICLLFSYANSAHERAIADRLRGSGMYVSVSHEVSPEFREYERASTTALNAAIGPLVSGYINHLDREFGAGRLLVMSSSGGLVSASDTASLPIRTATSGPAAGVVAAAKLAQELGFSRAIAFDMGGTSTDVTLIDGEPAVSSHGSIAGLPIRQSRVDVHTVGCGGGSIAWLDEVGALQVGPQSAGVMPGPALFGRGSYFTVTDANFLLGRIDADNFAGGVMRLDAASPARIAGEMASNLGCSIDELAVAVVQLAESGMAAAIRKVSSARGFDPAEFALVAFGGSGGLHACAITESLGINLVVVPAGAGVFSAVGLALAPEVCDVWRSVLGSKSSSDWSGVYTSLTAEGVSGLRGTPSKVDCRADFRYKGQSHEITVDANGDGAESQRAFVDAHKKRYGVAFESGTIEWVCARVRASIESTVDFPSLSTPATAETVRGPCVLSLPDSTTYVAPGWLATPAALGATRIERL